MSRQTALLLALAAIAVAAALLSLGSWVILRRGAPGPPAEEEAADADNAATDPDRLD